jgi:hypothetical protein
LAALHHSYESPDEHGLLIIRVPNAEFYRQQKTRLTDYQPSSALPALAYNNLPGFW